MRKRFLMASLMLTAVALTTATPMVGASAASETDISDSSNITVSALASSDSSQTVSQDNADSQSTAVSTANRTSGDKIQTLTSQTMILKKILVENDHNQQKNGLIGVPNSDLVGVNGAVFKIYDVTELMNTIIKEQLKTDPQVKAGAKQVDQAVDEAKVQPATAQTRISDHTDQASTSDNGRNSTSSGSESSQQSNQDEKDTQALAAKIKTLTSHDTLRDLIADRAAKLAANKLKAVATVTTATDKKLKSAGVATVKLPIDGQYHAYYVVNSTTPSAAKATNADPIVVLTPVVQADGLYAASFTIFPKSDRIPATTPKPTAVVTHTQMYQTGMTKGHSWLAKVIDTVWNWF